MTPNARDEAEAASAAAETRDCDDRSDERSDERPGLVAFVDGELTPTDAESVRDHLRICEPCRDRLRDLVQLDARLSALAPRAATSR